MLVFTDLTLLFSRCRTSSPEISHSLGLTKLVGKDSEAEPGSVDMKLTDVLTPIC
jgi:hypothetical protein